jgi:CRP-like cAMP-binding protein
MQSEAGAGRSDPVAPRPLAELLACPASIGNLLSSSAVCLQFGEGDVVFRQGEECRGLYLVVSGQFQRRTERRATRLLLGQIRAGELVEIGAALGDARHTCTLTAISAGSFLLLPIDALIRAFDAYPPMRMQLLEELAREVSRGYQACGHVRVFKTPHSGNCGNSPK